MTDNDIRTCIFVSRYVSSRMMIENKNSWNKNNFIYFRLAVNNMQYLGNVLGIKDPIHKQKIALKAMDVVLFGPPKGKI